MRRYGWSAVVIGAVMALTAACGDDADDAEDAVRDVATTISEAADEATQLDTDLTGTAEVPGPGDPDGTGTASVNFDVTGGEVCYEVTLQNVDTPTAMHIHEAEAGKAGDVVVTLITPTATGTTARECTDVDLPLLGRITAQPDNFYLNVHTGPYPQGAVRGQLSQ